MLTAGEETIFQIFLKLIKKKHTDMNSSEREVLSSGEGPDVGSDPCRFLSTKAWRVSCCWHRSGPRWLPPAVNQRGGPNPGR